MTALRQTHLENKRRQRAYGRKHKRDAKSYTYTEIRFGGLWLKMAGWSPGDYAEREDHGNRIELTRVAPSKATEKATKVVARRQLRGAEPKVYPEIRLIDGISNFIEPGEPYEITVRKEPGRLTIKRLTKKAA